MWHESARRLVIVSFSLSFLGTKPIELVFPDFGFNDAFNNDEIDELLPDLLDGVSCVYYPFGKVFCLTKCLVF